MLVETYDVSEVQDQTIQDHEACLELVSSLGLTGQQELINPEKTNKFPYRKMTADEMFVYGLILPEVSKIETFSESQIPLRVLQVYSHSKTLEFFDTFEVWHSKNADVKDPLLVAKKGTDWQHQKYILARWGEVLESFDTLKQFAIKAYRNLLKAKYTEQIEEGKSKLILLDSFTDDMIFADKAKGYNNAFSL